ncbi:hypothetical protein BFW01_g12899 [Lasiodiplodia theobromae]|nr:hypothetical protein BFW01_g12899 [Lasiodiplodia theobromae]
MPLSDSGSTASANQNLWHGNAIDGIGNLVQYGHRRDHYEYHNSRVVSWKPVRSRTCFAWTGLVGLVVLIGIVLGSVLPTVLNTDSASAPDASSR